MPHSTLCRAMLPALLVFTCLASGCSGIHFTRHVQLASVQATSLRTFFKFPARNYTSILYRADLDASRDATPFILKLPDQRVVALHEMSPAIGEAIAAEVMQCTWKIQKAGADSAAMNWNRLAPKYSRVATDGASRSGSESVSGGSEPAAEVLVGMLRYQSREEHPKKWSNPVAEVSFRTECYFLFWFERGRCVQVEVTRVDPSDYSDEYYVTPPANYWRGGRDVPNFVPAIGQRRAEGERLHLLPISEEELTDLFGEVLLAFTVG